ncbi:MAG: heme lyase CcmF/NrfE family subunit [Rhodobacteraceae bacterium]|nr:heme lyase CcmF/NrfE family subunit [Paracoccaceae bacterium]
MIEYGHFSLSLAFVIALLQLSIPLAGIRCGWSTWTRSADVLSILQFVAVAFAYVVLTIAFVQSDFSVALVAQHSHTAKPLIYKLSGVWGNHEGSMLLWILVLTLFGAAIATTGRSLSIEMRGAVLAVQAAVSGTFMAYLLWASNPFWRLSAPPLDGGDLNPLLQDPGLAFHPPLLYLGYVGLSVAYSFAIAALLIGRVDVAWAKWMRPWVLVSWIFLTLGIAAGSWWAYYELGWGGWWFWDPVENASLIPWLAATALIHSAIVVEKRESLKGWTVLLAILAFSFSLLGTFLVRSGVITSVHSFASDPTRGVFILGILTLFSGGGLILFALRSGMLAPRDAFAWVSRETAIVSNNILLIVAAFVVIVGTFWPLIAELFMGTSLSVGPPYFNKAFTPFFVAIAVVMPFGAVLAWKRGSLKPAFRLMRVPLAFALMLGVLVWSLQGASGVLAPIGLALSGWLMAGSIFEVAHKIRLGRIPIGQSLSWLARLPRRDLGKATAHAGVGLSILGIAAMTAWQIEDIRAVNPGDSYKVGKFTVEFRGVDQVMGPNFVSTRGEFSLSADGQELERLYPEKRFYPAARSQTTEAAIHETLSRHVYVVLGDKREDGSWSARVYFKPLASWIWLGAVVMALGAMLGLADGRSRAPLIPGRSAGRIARAD